MKICNNSGIIDRLSNHVLGSKTSQNMALFRMCILVFLMSAFFNNTPIVVRVRSVDREFPTSCLCLTALKWHAYRNVNTGDSLVL